MWKLALVLVALASVKADTFTFAFEDPSDMPGVHSETVYLVDNGMPQPRIVGMVQSYEAQRSVGSLFSSQVSDDGWSSWVDTQLDLLESLHSALFGSMPCGMQRMSQPDDYSDSFTDAPYSALLAHMAKSRFGPTALSVYAQQLQDDEDDDFVDRTSDSSAVLAGPTALAGWGSDEEQLATLRSTYALPTFLLDGEAAIPAFGGDAYAVDAEQFEDSQEWPSASEQSFPLTASVTGAGVRGEPASRLSQSNMDVMQAGQTDDIDWSFQAGDGDLNWGMVLFVVLMVACGAVWFSLLRSWCRFRAIEKQVIANKKASAMENPLLAPLMHESVLRADSAALHSVQVAAEHVPAGSVEYVSIAYVPLKSEV